METLDTSTRYSDDVLTVGQTLSILCQDFNEQIAHRKYFYKSSSLLHNAVISLSKARWHSGSGDLTENRIMLDRRILDWVVGLDSEINELVEGSDLYVPNVDLSQVILPQGYTEKILSQCLAYDDFESYRIAAGLDKKLSYGNSLVILLCGKSGTGKTMTVNAIANYLKKKVLLVDFSSLLGKKDSSSSGDVEVDLKGLFRESKMSNAILFFDECEIIFKSRNLGGDRILNSMLTEIERHDGIVFMATNRPYEIDEAMHRRITMVLEYREPDYHMRKRIWNRLLFHDYNSGNDNGCIDQNATDCIDSSTINRRNKLNLSADVNTSVLAIRYELTGGFIKNAVLSAILRALSRDKTNPLITQDDLVLGCQLQMRGNLIQKHLEEKVTAKLSLSELFLTEQQLENAMRIIRHEQARATVYGSWNNVDLSTTSTSTKEREGNNGMESHKNSESIELNIPKESKCEQMACINLFVGLSGSGKATLAKAIAFELENKYIKYLHIADFLNKELSEIISAIKSYLKDARMLDALVIIDGFEHVLDNSSEAEGSGKIHLLLSRIMDILYRYQGSIFLLCHMENPQNITLHR